MMSHEGSGASPLSRAIGEVDEMADSVDRLTRLQRSMDEQVREAGRSSRATIKVAQSIADVARATRMLSINASIEAARVGELGAGFGIVASEVGTLSQRTATAAEESARLLGDCEQSVKQLQSLAQSLEQEIRSVSVLQKKVEASLQQATRQADSGPSRGEAGGAPAPVELLVYDPQKMSTGVESVDHQHKKLIDMIRGLDEAVARGEGKQTLGKMLDFLATYVVEHFKHEECVFTQKKCPNAQKNKDAHAQLIQKYTQWRAQYDASGVSLQLVADLSELLKGWLVSHICGVDRSLRQSTAA